MGKVAGEQWQPDPDDTAALRSGWNATVVLPHLRQFPELLAPHVATMVCAINISPFTTTSSELYFPTTLIIAAHPW